MKEKTKIIISVIITFVITLTLTVTASLVTSATNITYTSDKTNKTNVNDSLDELYDMANSGSGSEEITNAYGVKRTIYDAPSTAWERVGLSTNLEANATKDGSEVVNDFDNIYPWSEIKSYNYDTTTESITSWYGEDNFTFTPTDNTTEVLTYIPEFYYTRYQAYGYEYIYISKEPKEGFNKSEAFSVGRYLTSGNSSRVHSRSGVSPFANTNIETTRTYATALGNTFQLLDYHYFIIQLLYLVEYADYNGQSVLGLGNSSNSRALASGGCDSIGMKSGTLNNDGKHSMIYRGIEDIYGNFWQLIDGINMKGNQIYINYNPETYLANKYDGDYKPIAYINSGTGSYIKKLGYDVNNSLVMLPIEIGGSATTYVPDYYISGNDARSGVVGGQYGSGLIGGLYCWSFYSSSSVSGAAMGSRLLKTS